MHYLCRKTTVLIAENMKRIFLYLLFATTYVGLAYAQSETTADTLRLPGNARNIDGFLLDMSLLQLPELPSPFLSGYQLEIPDASKDYSFLFRLDPNSTYTQVSTTSFGNGFHSGYSSFGFGQAGPLQMGSFRLKNGMRINTYGEYNQKGWRMHNPSALPWERNNFRGAFELKSANGNFGIRLEVQQGR